MVMLAAKLAGGYARLDITGPFLDVSQRKCVGELSKTPVSGVYWECELWLKK